MGIEDLLVFAYGQLGFDLVELLPASSVKLPSMFQGQIWMGPWDSDIEKRGGGLRDGARPP